MHSCNRSCTGEDASTAHESRCDSCQDHYLSWWQANAVMKWRLPALSVGTRVSLADNCRKQKPQID